MNDQVKKKSIAKVEPRLWTIPQTSEALNISCRSVYRLAASGQLALKKVGRCSRILVSSVNAYINGGA